MGKATATGEIAGSGADRRALDQARVERRATALLVGGSVALALACSRYGAGIGGDGYVMASRNLLGGNGLSWVGAAGVLIAARRILALPRGRPMRQAPEAVLIVSLAFACAYALVLLASLSFVDASTPLNDRILSPPFVFGLIACPCALASAASRPGLRRWLAMAGVGGMLALMLGRGGAKVVQLQQDGQGYAGQAWRESEIVAWVAEQDSGIVIYSNEPDALYLLTGRQA